MQTPILLADDHQLVLDGIVSLLQGSDYHIIATCNNGEEVLKTLAATEILPEIVLTDIKMPLLNGIDLCRKIKETYPNIKVVMLSMYSSADAIREALNAEADGFMLKNTTKKQFLEGLHKVEHGGTYFSEEIIPFLYQQILTERTKTQELVLLSDREREVLLLIAQELTSDEIAERLFISKKTVDNHRTNMLHKTGSKSTVGLVKFAIRTGMLQP